MIYTNKNLRDYYTERLSRYDKAVAVFGARPKPLFIDGEFNFYNYKSGEDVIRERLTEEGILSDNKKIFFRKVIRNLPDPNMIVGRQSTIRLDDPLNAKAYDKGLSCLQFKIHAMIDATGDEKHIIINIISDDINMADSYVVCWLKSNNDTTKYIKKNGNVIYENEYIDLLNILSCNHFFEPSDWELSQTLIALS